MNIHWHEGLFLQPHHLQMMQRRMQLELRAWRLLTTPYAYGVVDARISADELADGRVRFERLHVIMPSGQEVRYPEDASLPSLDVRAALEKGAGKVDILLGVPLWVKNRANAFRIGEPPDPRVKLLYIPEEAQALADENTGDNPQALYMRKINARLMLRGDDTSDLETLPILRVTRDVSATAGQPRQDPEFVAPALWLRSAPYIHDLVRNLTAQLQASRAELHSKVTTGGKGLEVKWELTLKLTALNRHCSSLPSLVEDGTVAPYTIYLRLRELLGELLVLNPEPRLFECLPYDHLNPLGAFTELDRKIRKEILVVQTEPLKVEFAGNTGLVRASLKPEHFAGKASYFLGVKTKVERSRLAAYVVDGNKFKLMPQTMETFAILGVKVKEEGYPPLELPTQGMYYFRLEPLANPGRWEQVMRDKAMSLVWNNGELNLSDASFTLYILPSGAS